MDLFRISGMGQVFPHRQQNILYLDGHAKSVLQSRWAELSYIDVWAKAQYPFWSHY